MGTPPNVQFNRAMAQQLLTTLSNLGGVRIQQGGMIFGQPNPANGVLRFEIMNHGRVIAQADVAFSRTGAVLILGDKPPIANAPGVTGEAETHTAPEFTVLHSSDVANQSVIHSESPLTTTALFSGWQSVYPQDSRETSSHSPQREGAPTEAKNLPREEAPLSDRGRMPSSGVWGQDTTRTQSTSTPSWTGETPRAQTMEAMVREVVREVIANLQIVFPDLQTQQSLPDVLRTLSDQVASRMEEAVRTAFSGAWNVTAADIREARQAIENTVTSLISSSLVLTARDSAPVERRSAPGTSGEPSRTPTNGAEGQGLFAQSLPQKVADAILGKMAAVLTNIPQHPLAQQQGAPQRPQIPSQKAAGEGMVLAQQAQPTPDKNQVGARREVPVMAQAEAARTEAEKRSQSRVLGTEGREISLEEDPTVIAARGSALEDATSGESEQEPGRDGFEPSWNQIEAVLESFGSLNSVEDGAKLLGVLAAFVPAGHDLIDLLAAIDRRRGWGWAEGSHPVVDAIQQVASFYRRPKATKAEVLFDPFMSLEFLLPMFESGGPAPMNDEDMVHLNPERMAMHQHLVQMYLDRPGWMERTGASREDLAMQLEEAQRLMNRPFYSEIFLPSATRH